ncbi:MAG: HAD family hydrolase [Rhizobacter sp.]|nr:HAD family hydrolase [Chlorobiales bacterium]
MTKVKVLFLDRDGTIIYDKLGGYISTLEQVSMLPRADDGIALAKSAGYKIVIITNQAGIAKGIVTEPRVIEINEYMQRMLREKNAEYDLIYYSPYHPHYPKPEFEKFALWRKPETGMVDEAIKDLAAEGFEVDRSQSYFIGDKQVDVACGINAGLHPILVLTGYAEQSQCILRQTPPEYIAPDLYDAIANYILAKDVLAKDAPVSHAAADTTGGAAMQP